MATSIQGKWPLKYKACPQLSAADKKLKNSHGIFSLYSVSMIIQGTSLSNHLRYINANTVFFYKNLFITFLERTLGLKSVKNIFILLICF